MALQVVSGAILKCSFGASPSSLTVIPKGPPVLAGGPLAASIMDFAPMANILPFGTCSSMANPTVATATATATAAAQGVFTLTPMPCIPVTTPWVPGAATVTVNNFPALNNSSKCNCAWAGVISITYAGQATVMIP